MEVWEPGGWRDFLKFTGLFNVTGHPAITMNAGFTDSKPPVGLQLIGRRFEDKRLIEAAVNFRKPATQINERNQDQCLIF